MNIVKIEIFWNNFYVVGKIYLRLIDCCIYRKFIIFNDK